MVKESWDLGIPLFSNQRAHMAGPWLLGFKIRKRPVHHQPWPEDYSSGFFHEYIFF